MDKLDAFKVFVEVSKHQSFVAAADVLGLSAPTITKTIAALETRFNCSIHVSPLV